MSSRERRSVAQPSNYKAYGETGTGTQDSEGHPDTASGQQNASHQVDAGLDPSSPEISSQTVSTNEQDIVSLHPDIVDQEFVDPPTPQVRKKSSKEKKDKPKQHGARPKVKDTNVKSRDLSLPPPIRDNVNNLNIEMNKFQDEHDPARGRNSREPPQNKKPHSVVKFPEGYDGYYTVSESDNEPDMAALYTQHVRQSKNKNGGHKHDNIAHTDVRDNQTVTPVDNQASDQMNQYYDQNATRQAAKPPLPPHSKIPAKTKVKKEKIKQQELIDELANSDDLSYSRDTGMAYKKKSSATGRRDKRRVVRREEVEERPRTHHKTAAARRSRSPARRPRGYDRREPWDRRERSSSHSSTGEATSDSTANDTESKESTSSADSSIERYEEGGRHRRSNRERVKKQKRVKSGILAKPSSRGKERINISPLLVMPGGGLCCYRDNIRSAFL